jgi:MFS family permease
MRRQFAKWATAALFLVDGMGFGVWAAHVPVIQRNLHLSTESLSFVLFSLVVGSIISMPATGFLIARFGSRAVVRAAAALYILTIALLSQLSTQWTLTVGAGLFGATKGAFDVCVNAQAMAVELHHAKPSMNVCQGCWSLGGLLSAGASSILLRCGATVKEDFILTSIFLTVLSLAAFPWLIQEPLLPGTRFRVIWPGSQLLRLSIVSFFGLFAEGAVGDWAAVYLHSGVGASLSWAAAGYATYAIAMSMARFAGGWISKHISDATVLVASGLLLAFGFATLLIAHAWPTGFVGLVFTGIGMANIVPVVMKTAGRNKHMGMGPAISTVSTISYFGFLAGPPLIGWLAHGIGLQRSLILVICAGLIVAAGPRFITVESGSFSDPG